MWNGTTQHAAEEDLPENTMSTLAVHETVSQQSALSYLKVSEKPEV